MEEMSPRLSFLTAAVPSRKQSLSYHNVFLPEVHTGISREIQIFKSHIHHLQVPQIAFGVIKLLQGRTVISMHVVACFVEL